MKLYDISDTYLNFITAVQNGDIPEEAIQDTLEGLDGIFEEKADNIACLIKALNAEGAAIKAEYDTLRERQKSKEKTAEHLKSYLATAMIATGKTKLETARNKLSFRKSKKLTVNEAIVSMLSADEQTAYLRYKDPEVDKVAITAAIKLGTVVPGAVLVDSQNLQIK